MGEKSEGTHRILGQARSMYSIEILEKYFSLTEKQGSQYSRIGELYAYWNERINVVSRKDIENIIERHVLHSMAIAKVMAFQKGASVLDVGTGGGFPGIPLAILFPETDFLLVDSIGKKIKVVQEVAQALELKNVRAVQARAESVQEKFDFVVSRAVTALPDFYKWVRPLFKKESVHSLPNGILYLKGGDLTAELSPFKGVKEYLISDFFKEDFFETKKVIYVDRNLN